VVVLKKRSLVSLACAFLVACGCTPKAKEKETAVKERAPGTDSSSWQNDEEVQEFLNDKVSVRVNARTNYLTYYENGAPMAKWKVATARSGKTTPRGMFLAHMKEKCPPWNNGAGKSAAACAADNPLGEKAIWWHDARIYGLHGVNQANIDSVENDDARSRDQSSGCVRNHPNNIEWLYQRAFVGMPVVVGTWDADPNVPDCSGQADCSVQTAASTDDDNSMLPKALPTWCYMNVAPVAGRARVRTSTSTASQIVDELAREAKIKLESEVQGEEVRGSKDWFKVSYTLGGNKAGFIHSSLVDCARTSP
jgi:hypothetical protein